MERGLERTRMHMERLVKGITKQCKWLSMMDCTNSIKKKRKNGINRLEKYLFFLGRKEPLPCHPKSINLFFFLLSLSLSIIGLFLTSHYHLFSPHFLCCWFEVFFNLPRNFEGVICPILSPYNLMVVTSFHSRGKHVTQNWPIDYSNQFRNDYVEYWLKSPDMVQSQHQYSLAIKNCTTNLLPEI